MEMDLREDKKTLIRECGRREWDVSSYSFSKLFSDERFENAEQHIEQVRVVDHVDGFQSKR